MTWRILIHIYLPAVREGYGLEETPTMSRFDINCGNVWREFEDEFTDIAPPSEYDQKLLNGW